MGKSIVTKSKGTGNEVGWTIRQIWRYAGIVGVHPDPFTYRELKLMAEGKMSHDWDMFAPLICYVANPNLHKRSRLRLKDIHPYYQEEKKIEKKFDHEDWLLLKSKIQE
jgi:hypothetical protein